MQTPKKSDQTPLTLVYYYTRCLTSTLCSRLEHTPSSYMVQCSKIPLLLFHHIQHVKHIMYQPRAMLVEGGTSSLLNIRVSFCLHSVILIPAASLMKKAQRYQSSWRVVWRKCHQVNIWTYIFSGWIFFGRWCLLSVFTFALLSARWQKWAPV